MKTQFIGTMAALLTLVLGAPQTIRAASATWTGTTDGTWATGTNWGGAAPGATSGTTSADTATFNGAGNGNATITIDANRNLQSITFDTAAAAYILGSAGANAGNALLLSSAGTIQMTAGFTGTSKTETINAPLILEPLTAATAGTHTFTNLNTTATNSLVFAGNISAGTTTSTETLTLNGAKLSNTTLNGATTIGAGNTGTNIISGAISDGGASGTAAGLGHMNVTVSGGVWELTSAASTYSGVTRLSGGTLAIGADSTGSGGTLTAGALGTSTLIMNQGTIIALGGARTIGNAVVFGADAGGTIGGSNDLTFAGPVSLKATVFTSNFQHWGTLTVNNTGKTTFSGGIDLNNQQLFFQGSGDILINSVVSDSAPGQFLRYQGTGSLTLSGPNTYADSTSVYQGKLIAGANAPSGAAGAFGNSTGAVSLGSTSATITGAASILTNGAFTIGRNITEVASPTNSSLSIGGNQTSGTSVYTGNITLTAATTLTSAAGGEVDFTTGIISGAFNVAIDGGGIVKLTGANTFGSATAHANSVTIQGGGTLNLTSAGSTIGAAGNDLNFNNGTLQFAAVFDPSASRTMNFQSGGAVFDTNGNTITFASAVGNSGTGGLTLNDSNGTPGGLILSAVNTYTGGTTVTKGTLKTSGSGTLGGTSGALTVNTNGTLDLNGTSQAVGNLTGTGGTIVNNSGGGTSTLTIGTGNGTGGSYAGVIADKTTGSGQVALTKTGSGTISLTGANTYTGATAITTGTLKVGGGGSLGGTAITASGSGTLQIGTTGSTVATTLGTGSAGSVTVGSGGGLSLVNGAFNTLAVSNGSNTGLSFGTGSSLSFDVGGSSSDTITFGSGTGVFASGTITVNLSLLSNLTGGTQTLIAGDFTSSGTTNFALGTTTNTGFLNGFTLSLRETNTGLLLDMASTSSAYWKGGTSASWATIGNFTTDAGGTTARSAALDSSTVVIFNATGASNFSATTLDGSYTISGLTFNIGGVGIANGTGTNALTIASGAGVTVSGGVGAATETIAANVVLGSSQTWTVTDAASTLNVSGNISGSGAGLSKSGAGTLVLSGNNSYTGATNITAGNVSIQSNGALGGTSSVIVTGGAALQMQGNISTSSATPLTLNGMGTGTAGALENVSGNNTYSGLITLGSAATIGSTSGMLTLSNTGTITGIGLNLTLAGAGNGSLASIIGTTSGSLTKSGAGTWTLSGANTYTGGTTVSGGTLALAGAGTLGAAGNSLTVNTGGALDLGGTSQTAGNFTGTGGSVASNGGSGTLTIGSGNGTGGNYAGALTNGTGTLALTKTGTGTLALSGANTYTGATAVSAGALNLQSNGAAAGSGISVAGGAALQLTGGITTTNAVSLTLNGAGVTASPSGALENVSGANTYSGLIALGSDSTISSDAGALALTNTGTITGSGFGLTLTGAGNGSVSGIIGTGAGTVTKNGLGTWTLSGANTYTGATTVNAGTLTYASTGALSNSSAINLGSAANAVVLNYSGAAATFSNALNFTGSTGTVTLGNSGTGNIVYSGTPTVATGTKTITLGNTTDTFGGSIGNIGDGSASVTSLAKSGTGTWTLTGTNTYSGTTTINAGVLVTPNALTNTVSLQGGVWQPTLTGNTTIGGTLGTSTGAGALNAWGAGGFAANGGKLTVTVNGGADLSYQVAGFLGAGGTPMIFGSATANNQVEVTNNINLNTADAFQRTIIVNPGTGGDSALLSGVLSGGAGTAAATGFVKQGDGTLILSGNNTYTGLTTINAGNLVAGASSLSGSTGAFGTGTGASAAPTAPGAIQLTATTGASPALLIGGAFTVGRAVTINNTATTGTYGIGGSTDNNATFSGLITTSQNLKVTQVATTGGNTLSITGGFAIGANTPTLNFDNAGSVSVDTTGITGAFLLTKTNTGTLTLSAANTYTGATTVNAGTLRLTGSLSGTNVTVNGAGATFNESAAGSITGAGKTFTLTSGSAIFSGVNTYTGATTISGGTLTVSDGSISNSSAITNNAALVYSLNSTSGSYGGVISGSGTFTKTGTSDLTFTGANTYTGATTITGGTLYLDTTGTIANSTTINLGTAGSQGILDLELKSGTFAFGAGQTLSGYGKVFNNSGSGAAVTVSGHLSPGNSAGIITVAGDLVLANAATVPSTGAITTMELAGNGGVAGTDYDQVIVNGQITFGGTLNVISYLSYNISQAATYHLFGFGSQAGSSFDFVSVAGTSLTNSTGVWAGSASGFDYTFTESTGDLMVVVGAAIPEPSTYAALAGGVALLGTWLVRRRRQAGAATKI